MLLLTVDYPQSSRREALDYLINEGIPTCVLSDEGFVLGDKVGTIIVAFLRNSGWKILPVE